MPFLAHFGLESYPFGLTPDPSLYYPCAEDEALLAALEFALTRGDGLLKIVGEVGTGKTLICRLLLGKLDALPVNTAYLNAPTALTPAQIPAAVAHEFGLKDSKDPAKTLRDYLVAQHGKGKRNILIVDEAQALGAQGLEAVRLLSNLETETDKLLQIVLFGQPELDRLLHKRAMRQIMQRINFSFLMKPFSADAIGDYVRFRLERCKSKPSARGKKRKAVATAFTPRAVRHLARASDGVPRLIHVLADKALLAAYAEGEVLIDAPHVRTACRESVGLISPWQALMSKLLSYSA